MIGTVGSKTAISVAKGSYIHAGEFSKLIRRYQVKDEIGRGGMGVVYRAFDQRTQQWVALKSIIAPVRHLRHSTYGDAQDSYELSLAREFQTLAALAHPYIVQVLDYGFDDQKRPYFTMELLDGALPFDKAAGGQPPDVILGWTIQLLQALSYLHQRGLLHRDIKPGNVLIVNGRVKVVDFGLSAAAHADKGILYSFNTPEYVAPEAGRGALGDERSDLYSVGRILYRVFGRGLAAPAGLEIISPLDPNVPFDAEGTQPYRSLNVTPFDAGKVNSSPEIRAVVARLLADSPADRYATAHEVIAALVKAGGLSLPPDSEQTRQSRVQSARFVGREAELDTLGTALDSVLEGKGGAILVRGEAGVGKSRLIAELRARALVRGALVLRAQASRTGRELYGAWHDLIRDVLVIASLTVEEKIILETALNSAQPGIEGVYREGAGIEAGNLQTRLFVTLESILSRLAKTLLIVVEDVQWLSDTGSLALLNRLVGRAPGNRWLIVATARDEANDQIDQIAPMSLIALNRLTQPATAELAHAMTPHPLTDWQTDWLHRQSEGNPFFLAEIMLEIAHQPDALPSRPEDARTLIMLPSGILSLTEARLTQVRLHSADYDDLLKLSAIVGTQIDPALIDHLKPGLRCAWLRYCEDARVLQATEGGGWRFHHDKLRETYLYGLTPTERADFHKWAAEGLETVYADRLHTFAATLAYHWTGAGNPVKARYYHQISGDWALRIGNYRQAATDLEAVYKARDLSPTLNTSELLVLERDLGICYVGLGEFESAYGYLTRGLARLRRPFPKPGRSGWGLVRALIEQARHRAIRMPHPGGDTEATNARFAAQLLEQLAIIGYFRRERTRAAYAAIAMLNATEQYEASPERLRAVGSVTVAMSALGRMIPIRNLPETYIGYLARLGRETPDSAPFRLAWAAAQRTLIVHLCGTGQWERANASAERVVKIAEAAYEYRIRGDALAHQQRIAHFQGDFDSALLYAGRLADSAAKSDNRQQQGWAHDHPGLIALYRGDYASSAAHFQKTADLYQTATPFEKALYCSMTYGGLAISLWHCGDYERANDYLWQLPDAVLNTPSLVYSNIENLTLLAEALMLRIAHRLQTRRARTALQAIVELIESRAKVIPIAGSKADYWWGRLALIADRPHTALKAWRSAITSARKYNLRHDELLAHVALAMHLPDSALERGEHRRIAEKLCQHMAIDPATVLQDLSARPAD